MNKREQEELRRQQRLAELQARWKALTDVKGEWPESEQEERFETILGMMLHTPPK